jgi:hypothetical protein
MNIPFEMKLVYGFRHMLGRQELFLSVERGVRREAQKKLADCACTAPAAVPEVGPGDEREVMRFKQKGGNDVPFVVRRFFSDELLEWRELRDRFGDSIVPVHSAATLGAEWQYRKTCQMMLADAMRAMEAGAALSVVSTAQVFVDHEELVARLNTDSLSETFGVSFVRQEMFVAAAGTGSAFHCAAGGNFFHMVAGRKRWVLVGPEHSFAMYPTIGRSRKSAIFCSPINSESYEGEQEELYPLYKWVPKYVVVLEPGDILFVPGWWWHEVKNIGLTIGVPFRSWCVGGRNAFFLLLTLVSTYGLKYLSRAFVSSVTGNRAWLMTDGIPQESFGGRRPGWAKGGDG